MARFGRGHVHWPARSRYEERTGNGEVFLISRVQQATGILQELDTAAYAQGLRLEKTAWREILKIPIPIHNRHEAYEDGGKESYGK